MAGAAKSRAIPQRTGMADPTIPRYPICVIGVKSMEMLLGISAINLLVPTIITTAVDAMMAPTSMETIATI